VKMRRAARAAGVQSGMRITEQALPGSAGAA
jgi:hypothetical protein